MSLKKRKTIALALGSGGSRGLLHIGVIKSLEKHGIPIDYIAGSSAGSLIGAMYAFRKNIQEVEDFWESMDRKKIFELLLDPSGVGGIIKGAKVKRVLDEYLENAEYSDLQLPFSTVVTNLSTGFSQAIDSGNVASSVRASCSIPFLMTPESIDGDHMADGGISNPVPVEAARSMGADIVIAVNIDEVLRESAVRLINKGRSISSNSRATVSLVRYHLARKDALAADFIFAPRTDDKRVPSLRKFHKSEEFIEAGAKCVDDSIDALRELIQ